MDGAISTDSLDTPSSSPSLFRWSNCFLCLSGITVESEPPENMTNSQRARLLRQTKKRMRETIRPGSKYSLKKKVNILLKYLLHSCHDGHERVEHHRQLINRISSAVIIEKEGDKSQSRAWICKACRETVEELVQLHGKLKNIKRNMMSRVSALKSAVTDGFEFDEEDEDARKKLMHMVELNSQSDGTEAAADTSQSQNMSEDMIETILELKRGVFETTLEVKQGPCLYLQSCELTPDPDPDPEPQSDSEHEADSVRTSVKVEDGFTTDSIDLMFPSVKVEVTEMEGIIDHDEELMNVRDCPVKTASTADSVSNHHPKKSLIPTARSARKRKGRKVGASAVPAVNQLSLRIKKKLKKTKRNGGSKEEPKFDGKNFVQKLAAILPPWIIQTRKPHTRKRAGIATYTFRCTTCPSFTTANIYQFIHHLRGHERDVKTLHCPEPNCSEEFGLQQLYDYHMVTEHNSFIAKGKVLFWQCSQCRELVSQAKFAEHVRTHQDVIYQCPYCYYCAASIKDYVAHQEKHFGVTQKCLFCSETFWKRLDWILHMQNDHQSSDIAHSCQTCGKTFSSRACYTAHLALHSASVECPYAPSCTKKFIDTTRLSKHVKFVHEKQMVHCCEVSEDCQERFRNKDQLEKHQVLQHNFPTFKCTLCPDNKEFFSSTSLGSHQRRNHKPKTLPCRICDKKFASVTVLTRHERTHGPKTLVCDEVCSNELNYSLSFTY